MTPTEFLKKTTTNGKPIHRYLAELFIMNGYRFNVTGWGCTSGGGPLGRFGLEQGEALSLMENGAYFAGLCDASSLGEAEAARDMIRQEIEAIENHAKQVTDQIQKGDRTCISKREIGCSRR